MYSFFIPDREYCTDLEGLLEHLWTKRLATDLAKQSTKWVLAVKTH